MQLPYPLPYQLPVRRGKPTVSFYTAKISNLYILNYEPGIILGKGSANERRLHYVTPSLIARPHTQNELWVEPKLTGRVTSAH